MQSLKDLVLSDEHITYEGGSPRSLLVVLVAMGVLLLPLYGLGALVLLLAYPKWKELQVVVTDRRLLVRTGLTTPKVSDTPLVQIQNVTIEGDTKRSAATFTIVGSGGTKVEIAGLERPSEFYAAVNAHRGGAAS